MSDPYNPGPAFGLNSAYGRRRDPITGEESKFHSGLDFKAPPGTPIPAATPREVVYSGFNENFGNTVIVKSAAGYSLYAHMQDGSPMPKPGQRVWLGDIIGSVGSTGARTTGPHLHYSVIKNDKTTEILGSRYRTGGKLGLTLTGDENGRTGNTIDPANYDTGVPYLVQAAVTGAGRSTVPSAPLKGSLLPNGGGIFAGRFGDWASLPDSATGAPVVTASRLGGLPGMIADYLRHNQDSNSQAPSHPSSALPVPFVPTNDPLAQDQPASVNDRFGVVTPRDGAITYL
jgi:Peptidase family M23